MSESQDAKWPYRLAGAAAIVGAVAGFFINFQDLGNALIQAGGIGLGAGVIVFLVGQFIAVIYSSAIEAAVDRKNPIAQGATFALFILVGIALFDLYSLEHLLLSFQPHPLYLTEI